MCDFNQQSRAEIQDQIGMTHSSNSSNEPCKINECQPPLAFQDQQFGYQSGNQGNPPSQPCQVNECQPPLAFQGQQFGYQNGNLGNNGQFCQVPGNQGYQNGNPGVNGMNQSQVCTDSGYRCGNQVNQFKGYRAANQTTNPWPMGMCQPPPMPYVPYCMPPMSWPIMSPMMPWSPMPFVGFYNPMLPYFGMPCQMPPMPYINQSIPGTCPTPPVNQNMTSSDNCSRWQSTVGCQPTQGITVGQTDSLTNVSNHQGHVDITQSEYQNINGDLCEEKDHHSGHILEEQHDVAICSNRQPNNKQQPVTSPVDECNEFDTGVSNGSLGIIKDSDEDSQFDTGVSNGSLGLYIKETCQPEDAVKEEVSHGFSGSLPTDSHLVTFQHLEESNLLPFSEDYMCLHRYAYQTKSNIAIYIILATHVFSKVWRGGRWQMDPEYHHGPFAVKDGLFVAVCQYKVFDRGKLEILVYIIDSLDTDY